MGPKRGRRNAGVGRSAASGTRLGQRSRSVGRCVPLRTAFNPCPGWGLVGVWINLYLCGFNGLCRSSGPWVTPTRVPKPLETVVTVPSPVATQGGRRVFRRVPCLNTRPPSRPPWSTLAVGRIPKVSRTLRSGDLYHLSFVLI